VQARLEVRVSEDAASTWMEVYEGVRHPEEFAKLLESAVGGLGLAAGQHASRRVERFRSL